MAPALPLYIENNEIAQAIGWSNRRALSLLRGAKIAMKRGRLWVTTRHLLREHFPEVHEELLDRVLARREADAVRPAPSTAFRATSMRPAQRSAAE